MGFSISRDGFKSLILHTMFSCFHNVVLLLEPSFRQLEVKETALSILLSSILIGAT